jgi:3-deoxy-manno-octulosonate cytidylyltransferase (CMP-KDO synthetase)
MRVVIVIPARFASTRLPGKPLIDILGKPMIQHVYERAKLVSGVAAVIVATDDERVAAAVRAFGGEAAMTSVSHVSGTDRIAEMLPAVAADLFVNLQGDEPLIRPADIETLIAGMHGDPHVQVGTLCHCISAHEAIDPNTVKTVLGTSGDALYFSRAAIPHARDGAPGQGPVFMKHIGIYAYRRELLAGYAGIKPSMLEETEKLEQLRLLSAGIRIRVWQVEPTGPGVDTPACLEEVRRLMTAAATQEAQPLWIATPTLNDVRLIITDVDGVLTDGGLYWNETGECMKRFHARDGLGIQLLQGCGIKVAVLSGRDSSTLRRRVSDLQIQLAAFGVRDKAAACRDLMAQAGVSSAQTLFVGDDSLDLPAFEACGLAYATADAAPYIQARASHVLATRGGAGALRELADAVLLAQGKSHVYSTSAGLLSVIRDTTGTVQ